MDKRVAYLEKKKQEIVDACTCCGKCLRVCPIFKVGKYKDRRTIEIMESVIELVKNGNYSQEAEYTVTSCMGCGVCTASCPVSIVPLFIFRAGVQALTMQGKAPPPLLLSNRALEFSDVEIYLPEVQWIEEVPLEPEPVEVVLFPGCDAFQWPLQVKTLIDIFNKMKVSFVTLWGRNLCCGAREYLSNNFERGDELAKKLIGAISAFSPKKAVFICGQCYYQFAHALPRIFDISFEPQYLPEFLSDNLRKIEFAERIEKVITLHDSCSCSRAIRNCEPARKLLQSISGIIFVEMEQNREDSPCCGGLTNDRYPERTLPIRKKRMDEVEVLGAEILVSDCIACCANYSLLKEKYSFEVISLITLLGRAMGIEYEDRYKNQLVKDARK
jgi:heterodisulfide reductase subunit D